MFNLLNLNMLKSVVLWKSNLSQKLAQILESAATLLKSGEGITKWADITIKQGNMELL